VAKEKLCQYLLQGLVPFTIKKFASNTTANKYGSALVVAGKFAGHTVGVATYITKLKVEKHKVVEFVITTNIPRCIDDDFGYSWLQCDRCEYIKSIYVSSL